MAVLQTLAEVAEIARERAKILAMALMVPSDEFYLDHPNKKAQQPGRCGPRSTRDARIDA